MRELGLPEGVLNRGGRVEGWLYFEKVDEEVPHLMLRVDLVHAQTGKAFGEVRIPFTVE